MSMSMVRTFADSNMYSSAGQLFSANYGVFLAAATNTVFTVPDSIPAGCGGARNPKYYMEVRQNSAAYVGYARNAPAVLPATTVFIPKADEQLIIYNPVIREVNAGDEINFISFTACAISLTLWYIPNI